MVRWICTSPRNPHPHPPLLPPQDTPRGKKITQWTEDISAYTLIYNIPFAERVSGWNAA